MSGNFKFNISLSVLNHLGRNLYRNVTTILSEAISNSWDADANNVWIDIDRDANSMSILDDGIGMDEFDFQNKFLRIGYSKRRDGVIKSDLGRPFIGRKGIGKLALLSCAERIHVLSKKDSCGVVGGIIDNSQLDLAITDDTDEYILENADYLRMAEIENVMHGTLIFFENISKGINNTVEYLRHSIALSFKFSMIDPNFNIFINGEKIEINDLQALASSTQFFWNVNSCEDPIFSIFGNEVIEKNVSSKMKMHGYIASVCKPSQLSIRGSKDKASIDLFVNGRLREKDILRHIPTSRIVENYVYGQIHCDFLDDGTSSDIFTSSREGIVPNSEVYSGVLDEISRIFKIIIDDWDVLRRNNGDDGDPDNLTITKKARKSKELFDATIKELSYQRNPTVQCWENELSVDAQFNIPSYAECFIIENLLRKYIVYRNIPIQGKSIIEEIQTFRKREKANKTNGNISFAIRRDNSDISYLSMDSLAYLADPTAIGKPPFGFLVSAKSYKPIRDAMAHTSLLTDTAKNRLNSEYENIKCRVSDLMENVDE